MKERRTVAFATLGCKVNQYDTGAMRALFEKAGYRVAPFSGIADVYVVNTCTVTQVSEGKSRKMVARAHGRNPDALIVVAGCYSQNDPEAVSKLPGVGLVLGTKDRGRIVELVEEAMGAPVKAVSDIRMERVFEELAAGSAGRTRAQLKIQDGCDRYCSYCIIPYVRGPVRSRGLSETAAEAERLSGAGYRELVITGIHLMSYGKDLGITLRDAIDRVAAVEGIRRIRLGSLEPALMDGAFADYLKNEPKICRQFHLSLQSGSETVLRRMNRRYTPEEYAAAVSLLRAAMPGCAITTDVIAGFPGETEEEHHETMAFTARMAFARVHVFPYSRRTGTKAAELPGQLSRAVKEARARALIELGERLSADFIGAQAGSVQEVLVEKQTGGAAEGYTGNYIHVRFSAPHARAGDILRVRLTGAQGEGAVGILLE